MTYPHMGNYGAQDDWNESGPVHTSQGCVSDPRPVKAAGFIVRNLYRGPVPPGRITLDEYLRRHHIPGITNIDTRKLTLSLRDEGSCTGIIIRSSVSMSENYLKNQSATLSQSELDQALAYLNAYPKMEGLNLVPEVGTDAPIPALDNGLLEKSGPLIALYDCGVKANILREFQSLGCRVSIFPSTATSEEILASQPDGIMISNGPGDPATLKDQVQVIQQLIGKKPVFGICLGHQLIAQALGARTYKMKFGHHGINHPVRDERTKKVFVTSQNHGFAVDESTLPGHVKVWFRNANDQTNEGIYSDELKVYSAQFHPESAPGPFDSQWIFQAFLDATHYPGKEN